MSIEIDSLHKEFNTPNGTEVAVDKIDLTVDEGEFLTLVGPSGCGKTTSLRCIAGLEQPTSGDIIINGEVVTDKPPNKRKLSMMFQNIALYPHMKIVDNISYPLKIRGVPKSERYEEAKEAAETVGIQDMLDKYPGELSGGQRQRAALARTLIQDSEAFLMDEPLSDLDAKLKLEVRKEIQRVHHRVNRPTIYVTHDQEEATTMSDRIAVMNDGNIEQIGSPSEIYNRPTNMFVARFMGSPTINDLNGTVESQDTEEVIVSVHDNQYRVAHSDDGRGVGSTDVKMGIRPQNVRITDDGEISGRVELVEQIENQLYIYIESSEGEIRATSPSELEIQEDTEVSFSLAGQEVHLFSAKSGETIISGKAELESEA